ncbi:MAG: GAF domain-containing protein, partial [Candidatus Sulfotelmatobacter sp.]
MSANPLESEMIKQMDLLNDLQNLNEKLRKEMHRLQMLLEVISLVAADWDLPRVFPAISARIRRVLRQEYASFSLYDATTGLLVCQSIDFPLGKGYVSPSHIAPSSGPQARVLQEGHARIFPREQLREFESETARCFLQEGIQSLCCIPLRRPDRALGVLVLGSTRTDAFKPADLSLLDKIGAQLAIAIENHRTTSEIEALKQRLG